MALVPSTVVAPAAWVMMRLFVDRQRVGNAADVEIDADRLEGRQHHLHDEGLVDGERAAADVAFTQRTVVGIDLIEDRVPFGEIVEDGVVRVARRRAT